MGADFCLLEIVVMAIDVDNRVVGLRQGTVSGGYCRRYVLSAVSREA